MVVPARQVSSIAPASSPHAVADFALLRLSVSFTFHIEECNISVRLGRDLAALLWPSGAVL